VANEPVFASLSEAEAYCKWSRGRVMTEEEYHLMLVSGSEVQQLRSGGWEWTSSLFLPFDGFVKMREYPEYSTDFFDGAHYVLKGASPVTHRCMQRDTFRNFYQRQYRYVFAKFRVCKNVASSEN
jgi:formylglycine-generating enzyme required for sulfatase activity